MKATAGEIFYLHRQSQRWCNHFKWIVRPCHNGQPVTFLAITGPGNCHLMSQNCSALHISCADCHADLKHGRCLDMVTKCSSTQQTEPVCLRKFVAITGLWYVKDILIVALLFYTVGNTSGCDLSASFCQVYIFCLWFDLLSRSCGAYGWLAQCTGGFQACPGTVVRRWVRCGSGGGMLMQ